MSSVATKLVREGAGVRLAVRECGRLGKDFVGSELLKRGNQDAQGLRRRGDVQVYSAQEAIFRFVVPSRPGASSGSRANPYGIYDIGENTGWVNVGITADTAEFAVESIRRWWNGEGQARYRRCTELLLTADGGGSNGYRVRLWKVELQGQCGRLGKDFVGSELLKRGNQDAQGLRRRGDVQVYSAQEAIFRFVVPSRSARLASL